MKSAFDSRAQSKGRGCGDQFPSYGIALRRPGLRFSDLRAPPCLQFSPTAGDKITWKIKDFLRLSRGLATGKAVRRSPARRFERKIRA
jgi:hypothetical protein